MWTWSFAVMDSNFGSTMQNLVSLKIMTNSLVQRYCYLESLQFKDDNRLQNFHTFTSPFTSQSFVRPLMQALIPPHGPPLFPIWTNATEKLLKNFFTIFCISDFVFFKKLHCFHIAFSDYLASIPKTCLFLCPLGLATPTVVIYYVKVKFRGL